MSVALPPTGLREQVDGASWYHTIELAQGIVTPGWFDTRRALRWVPLPASVAGKRCLDVGTYDGFWAFELERRGAAEVVAIDVLDPSRWDWPAGSTDETRRALADPKQRSHGFEIAHAALGSAVARADRSIYELDPAVDGSFDLVYVGSLLLHLRDPVGALQRVRSVCSGELVLADAIDLGMSLGPGRAPTAGLDGVGRPWWFKPNVAGLRRMVESAGFELVAGPRRFLMPWGAGATRPRVTPRALLKPGRLDLLAGALRGDPHAALRARPI